METLLKLAEIPIGSYATWGIILFVGVTGLVQISPIKIDPWSKFAHAIGRAINKEVIDKVKDLENEVSSLREIGDARAAREEERHILTQRRAILRFGDEVGCGQNHSKEHFNDILMVITEYDNYCNAHPGFKNQMTASAVKLIVSVYEKCLEDDSFLK